MLTGRYEIRGKLGQGGLGAIYVAYDQMLHREVALKRIISSDAHSTNPEASNQLAKEAGALSALQHPHIVTIFDVGVDHEGPFVVMELLQGKTVDDVVEAAVFTWEDFREFALQTQEALIAAQDLNMVHRDLKPTNIMLTWLPSGKFQVKIVDFGLAKYTPKPSLQTSDQTDAVFGSIFFMAPEQFERVELDARTDMYAIGCVYYYALTGLHPFGGDTGPQVMASHLQHQVYPLHDIRPDLPRWVSDWIMWHINRLPEHRPAQARQALEIFLQNAQRGDTDQADPMSSLRPPAPLTSLLKTAPQRITPPERLGRSSIHTSPLISEESPTGQTPDSSSESSALDSSSVANESADTNMSDQPNPPTRPRLIIPGAPAQTSPAATQPAPASASPNRARLLIPGSVPTTEPELVTTPAPIPAVAIAPAEPIAPVEIPTPPVGIPVAQPEPDPIITVVDAPVASATPARPRLVIPGAAAEPIVAPTPVADEVSLPEPAPVADFTTPTPVAAEPIAPVAVTPARPRLLIPGAAPTPTPAAPIVPTAIPVAVPATISAQPEALVEEIATATPVAIVPPTPEPAFVPEPEPQPVVVATSPIPQPAIFPTAQTMPEGFRPVAQEPIAQAYPAPAPAPVFAPPIPAPVIAPPVVTPVVAPAPVAATPPPPVVTKPALQVGPTPLAARPVATATARPTSALQPGTAPGLKTASASSPPPTETPAPAHGTRPIAKKKKGMSNSAKAVLATVLGLFVIIAAAVLISTSAKSKINKRYNALVELAAMSNTKELPVSSKDLDILLTSATSLAASSSRETVYKALYIAESADGSDVDAKLVNFVLQTPMNEDIRVNLISRVIAGRIKRGHASESTAEALIAFIKSNPKPTSAAAAVSAIREMANDSHFAALMELLQFSGDANIRKACEEVLVGIVKKSSARATLDQSAEPAFSSASSPEVKQALLRILGATGTPKAKETILAQLKGSDKALQIAAADASKHWPDDSLVEEIIATLSTTEDPALRRRLFHSSREFLLNESKRSDDRSKALWQALADAAKGEEEQVAVISSLVTNSTTNRTSWAPEIIRKYEQSSQIDRVIDMAGKALNRLQEKNGK